MHSATIPKKLKNDAIVEAVFGIQFETTVLTEILFGRLADYGPWKEFEQHSLPASVVPHPIRQFDPNLRYAPSYELVDVQNSRSVQIGERVLSYHRLAPYIGWPSFKNELSEAIEGLFEKADNLKISRLGLRYINALRPSLHNISSLSDLDLELEVAGETLCNNVNINFTRPLLDDLNCTVRIATQEFVTSMPPDAAIIIDVDVFTNDNFKLADKEGVKNWIEVAHNKEKEAFFKLLTDDTITALEEK